MYPSERNKAEVNESLVLEYHSPERIKYEKETIPHMKELSRFDQKMTSDLELGLEQKEKKSRYHKIDSLKAKKLKTEIEENNKEVELELEADGYQGLKALYDKDLL